MNDRETTKKFSFNHMADRSRWGLILAEILIYNVFLYFSTINNLPKHEYIRFLALIPVLQAGMWYGYAGGIIGSCIVTMLFVPVIPMDPLMEGSQGLIHASIMIVFINICGIFFGGAIGKSRRTRSYVHTLSDLSLAIAREGAERDVLLRLAQEAASLVDAQHAQVLIRNPDSDDPADWFLETPGDRNHAAPPTRGHPLVWAARTRQVLATNSVATDPRLQVGDPAHAPRSLLVTPVQSEEQVHGALLVADKRNQDVFTDRDLSMVRLVAGAAGAAVHSIIQERRRQQEQLREEQMKELFSRFVSSSVADYVLNNPDALKGRHQEVTLLVTDIRDFTSIAESMPADLLVEQLNEYFTRMVDVIFNSRGTVDKFIGDCIIAYWGAPAPDREHAHHAARAALDMAAALEELNRVWSKSGKTPFRSGIALHTCRVLMGTLGDDRKRVFTIMGEPVQQAMDLEGQCKKHGVNIIVSETAAQKLTNEFTLTQLPNGDTGEFGRLYHLERN